MVKVAKKAKVADETEKAHATEEVIIMAKKTPKMPMKGAPPKGMHMMKGGMMMLDAKMPWMAGKPAPKKAKKSQRKGKK